MLCFVAGCGRPPQPAPSSAPESSTPLPASEPLVVAEGTDITSTLDQLSLELRKYVARTKTAPKSFEEFASAAHVQAPAPPGGKKYVLEKGNVTLANR